MSGANLSLIDLIKEIKDNIKIIVIIPRIGDLSEELDKIGITYIVLNYGTWVYQKNEKWYKKITKMILNFLAEYRFSNILRQNNIDIVHYNSTVVGLGAKTCKKKSIPYIYHLRERAKTVFGLNFFNEEHSLDLISNANLVIGISSSISTYYEKILDRKVELVYNGLPIENEISLNKRQFKKTGILMIGAISPDKGQIDAIKAIKVIKESIPNILLTLVGKVSSTSYFNKLESFIRENQLQKNINIIGFSKEIKKIREEYDFVFVCSKNEAFGRVTIEAMKSGQIVFGANTGGTKEIINNEIDGYLYESENPNDLANKFLEVYDNPELLKNISLTAVNSFERNFSIVTTADSIISLYRDIWKEEN